MRTSYFFTLLALFVFHETAFADLGVYTKWITDLVFRSPTYKQEQLTKAKELLMAGIEQEQIRNGKIIGYFLVRTDAECALACAIRPACHFIDVQQHIDGKMKGDLFYNCWLYTRNGNPYLHLPVVDFESGCTNKAVKIKQWLNGTDVAEKFV